MKKSRKEIILSNRDDLVEGTFCYSLFEQASFECCLLTQLIHDCISAGQEDECDEELKDFLLWMTSCVDQCFLSHKEESDLFAIKNYSESIEDQWRVLWKSEIRKLIGIQRF